MLIFFQELLMLLFLWLLKLIDGIMEVFSAIAGIANVTYQGRQINILDLLITDSSVGTVFWCILILAVGLTCLFAIVGLIKNMITNQRQVSSIMGKFFLALLGTLAMLTVVILGILISNAFLKLVSEVFMLNGDTKLSTALFNACVGDWKKGHSIAEFNTNVSVEKIFGDYSTTLGFWPKSWKQNGMINPDTFMYLPALIASVGLLIALIVACINLAKRVYEIILLYLVMPVSMSTLPMDDGARFKIWRETFVTKIILAYGTVFSVNLFILLLPIIAQMKVTGASAFANSIFYIFMLVGGAMVIPAGQNLFAKLFGSVDDNTNSGGSFLRGAFFGSRMVGAATIGLAMKAAKGGAGIGKKIAGGKDKKSEDEKFSDDKKSSGTSGDSGGGDDGGGSGGEGEKFNDNGSSTGKTDSTDNKASDSTDNKDNKTSSDSNDSQKHTDNQGAAAVITDNNASSDNADSKTSDSTDSQKHTDNQGAAANTDNKTSSDSADGGKFSDSQTTVVSTTNTSNTSSEKADSETSAQPSSTGGAASSDKADSGKYSDSQGAAASTDGKVSESTESGKFSDSQTTAVNTDSITPTAVADSTKSSESTAVSTDSKVSESAENEKYSDSHATTVSTDGKTSSDNADSKTATQSADTKTSTDNAESNKYTDSQLSAVSTDIKTSLENSDSGKHSDSQTNMANTDTKSTSVSTETNTTSQSANGGKPSVSQAKTASTESKATPITSKPAVSEKYSDSQTPTGNSGGNETAGGKTE